MTDQLKVVPLHDKAMAMDIIGSMRRAADSVEAETDADDRTIAGVFVTVSAAGKVELYGWGRVTDRWTVIGMLHAAIATQA
jgi:hypothetical protein